jgi:hypothetical protein
MTGKHQATRLQWRINHLLGVLFLLVIVSGANYLAYKFYYRANWSSNPLTKLAEATKSLVAALPEEAVIINYASPKDSVVSGLISADVEQLLEEYRYASKEKIKLRKVDPNVDFEDAKEVAKEYKLALQESALIIVYGGQHRVVNYTDLAEVESSGMMYGMPPRVTAFKAEPAVTEALQGLVQGKKARVVFLTGHGEYDPEAAANEKLGLSLLASYIGRQNAEVVKVNLVETGKLPEDADLVVVAGPKGRYLPEEVELLKGYFKAGDGKDARLMLFLDPQTESGLEDFLADYGVGFRNDVVLTPLLALGGTSVRPLAIATQLASHPVLSWAAAVGDLNLNLGACRSLAVGDSERKDKVVELLRTPASAWGETGPLGEGTAFDEAADHKGPLTVAVVVDEGRVSGGEVALRGDRLLATGGASFLTNQMLQMDQLDYFINAMNWMLERGGGSGITPKQPQEFQVKLEDAQRRMIVGTVLLVIPGAGLLAGLLVWWRRRG